MISISDSVFLPYFFKSWVSFSLASENLALITANIIFITKKFPKNIRNTKYKMTKSPSVILNKSCI